MAGGLVWADVRRFLKNPGEVLERVRKQIGGAEELGGELEARREDLAKRLASRQTERWSGLCLSSPDMEARSSVHRRRLGK